MRNMKHCMNRHIFMHSLFGLGLGLILLILSVVMHPMAKDKR
jgi:hypothetical protein